MWIKVFKQIFYFILKKEALVVEAWGSADIPEVLLDARHPRGTAALDFLWSKCKDVLKRSILLENVKTTAEL